MKKNFSVKLIFALLALVLLFFGATADYSELEHAHDHGDHEEDEHDHGDHEDEHDHGDHEEDEHDHGDHEDEHDHGDH